MVTLEQARESNARCSELQGLVGVFAGGTGGIGHHTVREFFRLTKKPKAYVIGRNASNGANTVKELEEVNPEGQVIYIQKDLTLIKNVDELCEEIKSKETKLNFLFMTSGFLSLSGRTETEEGLDSKMVVNYYSRMRMIQQLAPLLDAAGAAGELSRASSVLAAGSEGKLYLDDLGLEHNFGLHSCLAHCVVMNDLCIEEFGKRYPRTTFMHSYPGSVKTGIVNQLSGPVRLAAKVFYSLLTPWIIDVKDSGVRHFFQQTSAAYPAPENKAGIPLPDGVDVAIAVNGVKGGGVYLLDWDGSAFPPSQLLLEYRRIGLNKRIWDHTMDMFRQAKGEKKRARSRTPEGSRKKPPPDGDDGGSELGEGGPDAGDSFAGSNSGNLFGRGRITIHSLLT